MPDYASVDTNAAVRAGSGRNPPRVAGGKRAAVQYGIVNPPKKMKGVNAAVRHLPLPSPVTVFPCG